MKPRNTYYLSPERDSQDDIQKQSESFNSQEFLQKIFNALPFLITVLNEKRQVVFTNEKLLHKFGINELTLLLGKRTGEMLKCIHAVDTPAGCGNSPHCKVCGAVNTILESMSTDKKVVNECTFVASVGEDQVAYDFEVTATPFRLNGTNFTIFSMVDISSEKRRRILERIFFHDIINTAGNLTGLIDIIEDSEIEDKSKNTFEIIKNLSGQIIEEINSQKVLLLAESGELQLNEKLLEAHTIMEDIKNEFIASNNFRCEIKLEYPKEGLLLHSDKIVISRILKNMVKNAIEACKEKEVVLFTASKSEDYIRFSVYNKGFIPKDAQLQIFNRSFSTKGYDRGIGTYSVKILGEKYLRGKVGFTSTEKEGTCFFFDHPV